MSFKETLLGGAFLPESIWRANRGCAMDAGFICPQAFGRNTYSDKTVGPIIWDARYQSGSDITTFKWLKSIGFNPGHPNVMLGKRCIELATLTKSYMTTIRPVIGQWEVMYSMWKENPDWYEKQQANLVAIWPPYQSYLGTRDMLRAIEQVALTRGLKDPLIVAHPEHLPRCFFLARKIFGAQSVAIDGGTIADEEWFDRHSTQWQTRSACAWLLYELFIARPPHLLLRWI